ncbi:hypothetical protein Tco_0613120 [Tanacetum coccineum]
MKIKIRASGSGRTTNEALTSFGGDSSCSSVAMSFPSLLGTYGSVIMEYLVKISKKARILELKRRNMKITVLTTNTPYPSRKIRRICACTSLKTTKETRSIRRITSITVNGKNAYELKGKFLEDLHKNAFSGSNGEDPVEHIDYFLRIVDPIDLPNVNQDKLRVVVFLISLVGDAWKWFDEIKGSIDKKLQDYWWKDNDLELSPFANWRNHIQGPYANFSATHDSYLDIYRIFDMNKGTSHDEQELCDNATRELPVYRIKRYMMIKYSFEDDEKYVAIKEDEYEDLMITNEEACRAY